VSDLSDTELQDLIAQARVEERARITELWEAVGLRGAAAIGGRQSLLGLDGTSVQVDRHAINTFWAALYPASYRGGRS